MELLELLKKIELPSEVSTFVRAHESVMTEELESLLTDEKTWEEGLKELKERLGTDEDGLKSLAECLLLALKLHDRYKEKGISDSVFFETVKFCTRFVKEHHRIYGRYAFTWTWWFVRQLSFLEFRVGELEFEFTANKIYIHIPSDADMQPKKIDETLQAYRLFLETYFPEKLSLPWCCESWMLSPALKELLSQTSNILSFQQRFKVETVEESMAVLDWVFPGEKDLATLSERTSLQRNMKKYLLSGGNVGWAEGTLKQ